MNSLKLIEARDLIFYPKLNNYIIKDKLLCLAVNQNIVQDINKLFKNISFSSCLRLNIRLFDEVPFDKLNLGLFS
jgi:hypothetical protein